MPASDLKQALNILDPEQELRTDKQLKKYFVEREMSPIEEMRILLQETKGHHRLLFTGHRGSGKSTELAKLAEELGDTFMVIHYSVKAVLNLYDLDPLDVLISLALELIRHATGTEGKGEKRRVALDPKVLEHIRGFFNDLAAGSELSVGKSAGLAGELNVGVARLTAKISKEDATRLNARERVNHRVHELTECVEHLVKQIELHTERRALVIVEDLDKTDLARARSLFYEHANTLLAPPVSIVYTFPTALRHDNDFMQIESNFPEVSVLPNIKTKSRDDGPDPNGLGRLARILTQRVDQNLFEPDALRKLATMSGGVPRELIVLARRACVDAMRREVGRIDMAAVETAVRRKRMDYEVLLTSKQLERLREIKASKRVENKPEDRDLLHNLSVLEYRSRGIWYDVNPLIEPLLETE